MIKLKNIITEAVMEGTSDPRRIDVSPTQAQKLFRGSFSEATARYVTKSDTQPLIRLADPKTTSSTGFELIVPRKKERKSRDAANFYTVMMGMLPSWKGWPPRSFSVIFYLGLPVGDHAVHYGPDAYLILPKNESKIVVSSVPDLLTNTSMPHLSDVFGKDSTVTVGTSLMGSLMKKILELINFYHSKRSHDEYFKVSKEASDLIQNCTTKDYGDIIKLLDKSVTSENIQLAIDMLNNDLEKFEYLNYYKREMKWYNHLKNQLDKYGDWESFLSDAFDPEKNGLKLMSVNNVRNETKHDAVEAWTDSPCIMVHKGKYDIEGR